jgi:hypothetical protein
MATASTLSDGGFLTGTYDITLDGYAYTLKTVDHDLPVSEAVSMASDGTFKGGASVVQQQKLSVSIDAVTGIPAPSQLVPFALAIHGFSSKNWKVTNLKIASTNSGAAIRTYNADITQHFSAIS